MGRKWLEYTNSELDNRINLIFQHHLRDIPIHVQAKHDKGLFDYRNIAMLILDLDCNYQWTPDLDYKTNWQWGEFLDLKWKQRSTCSNSISWIVFFFLTQWINDRWNVNCTVSNIDVGTTKMFFRLNDQYFFQDTNTSTMNSNEINQKIIFSYSSSLGSGNDSLFDVSGLLVVVVSVDSGVDVPRLFILFSSAMIVSGWKAFARLVLFSLVPIMVRLTSFELRYPWS